MKEVCMMETEDLARSILGLDDDSDCMDIEELLVEKVGVDLEKFNHILGVLMPFIPPLESPISGEKSHCLVEFFGDGLMSAVVRVSCDE